MNTRSMPGPIGKLFALLFSITLLILTLTFSVIALPIIALLGLSLAGWFWWKTRPLRQQMQAAMAAAQQTASTGDNWTSATESPQGDIIEGECVRDHGPLKRLPEGS